MTVRRRARIGAWKENVAMLTVFDRRACGLPLLGRLPLRKWDINASTEHEKRQILTMAGHGTSISPYPMLRQHRTSIIILFAGFDIQHWRNQQWILIKLENCQYPADIIFSALTAIFWTRGEHTQSAVVMLQPRNGRLFCFRCLEHQQLQYQHQLNSLPYHHINTDNGETNCRNNSCYNSINSTR